MLSKTIHTKALVGLAATLFFLFCLVCPAFAKDGTDGTELQVAQPEQLIIQLGPEWAGVEFQLKTDSGLYPGTISVGEDGILQLEIGGSAASSAPTSKPAAKVSPSPKVKTTPSTVVVEESCDIKEEAKNAVPPAEAKGVEKDPTSSPAGTDNRSSPCR